MQNAIIAIVGGGFSGAMIVTQQILALLSRNTLAGWAARPEGRIEIKIYEPSTTIGPGEAYRHPLGEGDIFLLNQPAYAMSPFADQPDHFTSWLAYREFGQDQDSFVTRGLYGYYLRDVFSKAVKSFEASGIGSIQHVRAEVTDIIRQSATGCLDIVAEGTVSCRADAVILAPGHSHSDMLSELAYHPGYFAAPFDVARACTYLKDKHQPVLLVGTSQSMLDGLALLDHAKIEGPIYAVSRNLVKPWVFDAVAERSVRGQFMFGHLTPTTLAAPSALSFEVLRSLFMADLEAGLAAGFPRGHILSRFHAADLEGCIRNPATRDNFTKLSTYVAALYGNPTSPQRHALLEDYEKRGQLKYISADISKAAIKPCTNGFRVQFAGAEALQACSIFNSASFAMRAISDQGQVAMPLLERLDQRGMLKRHLSDKNAFASGAQNLYNLFLGGPCTNAQRWGVGTFRQALGEIAAQSVKAALQSPRPL